MNVNIVCRNFLDDRVLPRFARHLAERNGWLLSRKPNPAADLNYWLAYFERLQHPEFSATPTATMFTHLEEAGSGKAKAFHDVAQDTDLRISMNQMYAKVLRKYGKTITPPLPLELGFFTLADRPKRHKPVVGFAGYQYKSGRKGADLAGRLVKGFAKCATFTASGRRWPCETKLRKWAEMPRFYQGLDVFVCTSTIEGGPMTTLEAMATGCPVVIPSGVGLHDQIPDTLGVYRYQTGNQASLSQALVLAILERDTINREALREATNPHSIQAWADANRIAFESLLYDRKKLDTAKLKDGNHGIYMVAFGEPARACAKRAIETIRENMPGFPVALVSDRPLGNEHIAIQAKDADIGGRIAKLKVYDLAPKQWKYVLYLDADIEIHSGDPKFYFDILQDGWEFVICKDAHLHETMYHFQRRNNKREYHTTIDQLGTTESLQINGGVWAFRRCAATKRFFERWYSEWAIHKGRDQGALIRALYTDPLRTFWLCNEWNTLITPKGQQYPPGVEGSAGVLHFVGRARRWKGQVPQGKGLTDPEAWDMVRRFTAARKRRK